MFFLLLTAGLQTVQRSLAWTIVHLSNNPRQRKILINYPDSVGGAVEETLRFEAAVSAGRRTTQEVEIGGVTMAAGDQLVVMLRSANRDEGDFDEPHELQLDRSPNRHLSFGAGPHRCVGSHPARIELNAAIEALHRRIPDCALAENDPPLFHTSQVRGCAKLPITFTPSMQADDGDHHRRYGRELHRPTPFRSS